MDSRCPPGFESWKNIVDYDDLNAIQKISDWSKKMAAPRLGVPETSGIYTEFYPLWPNPRFDQLYGSYDAMLEKDGINKLLARYLRISVEFSSFYSLMEYLD